MDDKDLIIQHLITQRNDANNVIVNKMLEVSKLQQRVMELEETLKKTQEKEEEA